MGGTAQAFTSVGVAAGSFAVVAAGGYALALSLDGGETWQSLPLPADAGEVVGVACSPNVARDRTLYLAARQASGNRQPACAWNSGAPTILASTGLAGSRPSTRS